MFHLLPNEVLENVISFAPIYRFPLRQVCTLFRINLEPMQSKDFITQAYLVGDLTLIEYYNLPCSKEEFHIILRQGHEMLFRREENKISFTYGSLVESCVQGGNEYIISQLLTQGRTSRAALFYEACRQNKVDLVERLYEEETAHMGIIKAVVGCALDVLDWLMEKDRSYHTKILYEAAHYHQAKVLRRLPQHVLESMPRKDMFTSACSAPDMDMFEFLLEVDYLPEEKLSLSLQLAATPHVQMMRTLILERGWSLDKDLFDIALELGCPEMLSCLLELDCPRRDVLTLYCLINDENSSWLVEHFPLTEDTLMNLCLGRGEHLLFLSC